MIAWCFELFPLNGRELADPPGWGGLRCLAQRRGVQGLETRASEHLCGNLFRAADETQPPASRERTRPNEASQTLSWKQRISTSTIFIYKILSMVGISPTRWSIPIHLNIQTLRLRRQSKSTLRFCMGRIIKPDGSPSMDLQTSGAYPVGCLRYCCASFNVRYSQLKVLWGFMSRRNAICFEMWTWRL